MCMHIQLEQCEQPTCKMAAPVCVCGGDTLIFYHFILSYDSIGITTFYIHEIVIKVSQLCLISLNDNTKRQLRY